MAPVNHSLARALPGPSSRRQGLEGLAARGRRVEGAGCSRRILLLMNWPGPDLEPGVSTTYELSWSTRTRCEQRTVHDLAAILQVVDELSNMAGPPTLLFVSETHSERELTVGLGRNKTVLGYQNSNDPPYFVSIGTPDAQGEEWFCAGKERTYVAAFNLVPTDRIVPTIEAFINSRSRPETVAWEQL